ncbi:hypothetical protein FPQ18DRAFT_300858 [Pyronema domesticum]|nr:hypothetical protein FPQ18DRAFT_300858 [Pyronema domesticum]
MSDRNTITLRMVPGHKGIPGNERADILAKRGAEDEDEGPESSRHWLEIASKTWLKRKASERKSEEAESWIRAQVARSRAYIAPRKRKFELRPDIRHISKPGHPDTTS